MLKLDVANFRVELSSRPSVVNDRFASRATLDRYFVAQPEDWEFAILNDMQQQLAEEQRARQLAKRSIFNTYYMCVNQQGAYEELKDKPVGSCLFRPSPHGLDEIILTYKVSAVTPLHSRCSPISTPPTTCASGKRTPRTAPSWVLCSSSASSATRNSRKSSTASSEKSPSSSTPSRSSPSTATPRTCVAPRE